MIRQHPLTEEQLKTVIETSKSFGARTHAMFVLFASHGMRSTELAELRVSDVNTRDRTIRVRRLKGSISKVEAMSQRELDVVQAYLTERESRPNASSILLFPSHRSHRVVPVKLDAEGKSKRHQRHPDALDRSQIYNIFRGVLEAAGMPSTSRGSHALRHSLAQIAAEKNVPIKMLAQIMGHKNINSTAQYYEHRQSEVDAMRAKVLGL